MPSLPSPYRLASGLALAVDRALAFSIFSRAVRRRGDAPARGDSLLYIAASSLPYHVSGYTARAQAIAEALNAASLKTSVATRQGYPWDRRDRLVDPEENFATFAGVKYEHIPGPGKNRPLIAYALSAARGIAELAARKNVGAIHAASNHTNAIPALIAARRLSIPFQYEIRGLWELSRASRDPAFLDSPGYRLGLDLEKFTAENADRVFVISNSLKNYIVANWSVAPEKIEILPNCVNASLLEERIPEETVGLCYAGSLIEYEGLDLLLEALRALRERGLSIPLTIAGEGEKRGDLETLAARLNLRDQVNFLGRLTPAEARRRLASCDAVCLPRKPYEVCRLIPPLKLVEAMALGKPVIAPDLPVFREELGDLGYYFAPGDAASLASVLENSFRESPELKSRGAKLREKCRIERLWSGQVNKLFAELKR